MVIPVKYWIVILSLIFVLYFTAILAYRLHTNIDSISSYHLGEIILVNRNPDWRSGLGLYTTAVLIKKNETGYNVLCKVYIGNDDYYEIFPLGSVKTKREAYKKWGAIEWKDKELVVGTSAVTPVIIKRSQIENHH